MIFIKYNLLAGHDMDKYNLTWPQLMQPEVWGFPFEFLRPEVNARLTGGSQILEAAAAATLNQQYAAARAVGVSERILEDVVWRRIVREGRGCCTAGTGKAGATGRQAASLVTAPACPAGAA